LKNIEIEALRDFAIENLPRAQADREQVSRFGLPVEDLYIRLAATAAFVRARAGTTAVEYAAANVLETVCLLRAERDEKLPKATHTALLGRLTRDALQLCTLTGKQIPWLDAMPAAPEPEEENEEETQPTPATHFPPPRSIRGRWLSTKEAAEVLAFEPQTLRNWASRQTGPIRPTKFGNRNKWSGNEIADYLEKNKQ
jgi:hypothetical protein